LVPVYDIQGFGLGQAGSIFWVPAPCFAKASQGIDYDMQGFGLGQAAEDPNEITLRYLMGRAGQAVSGSYF